ncbi:minor capsid protein [Streptococcus sp. sy010]|uniref:minor capsid protein n=1 Tax=Streptococcus sp. sy010 TaxID=2600148 RepID=UPI0011B40D04|nr:minor capsid protein [Streptococcus sp. sy010]TWT16447.1 hypothetical protein FRX51_00600 [Streptococcus sp. sy010]
MASDYWKKRLEAEQLARIERDATLSDEMDRLYQYHFKELEKEMRAFSERYAQKNNLTLADVKARVDEMDVVAFEEKAKRYVAEKDFSAKANAELSLYNLKMKLNRLELLQYQLDLEMLALSQGEHQLTERFLNAEYVKELELQAGLLGQSVLSVGQLETIVKTILNTPFKGAVWSDKIWERQTLLREIVARMTEDYLLKGKNPTGMIPKLQKEFEVSARQAKRLAVTEGARIATAAQAQMYKANGYDEYEFVAEPKACQLCKPLDGKVFKVEKMIPGETAAPMHPYCRCTTVAYYATTEKEYERLIRESVESIRRKTLEKDREKVYNQNMTSSGAIYGAWNDKNDPYNKERDRHAQMYYEQVRNRDKVKEITRVAHNSNFSISDIDKIYNHVFIKEHDLDEGRKRFDANYDMAESWRRLSENQGKNIQKHDIIMLYHELMELGLMAKGMNYNEAHEKTNEIYHYQKAWIAWAKEKGDL